MTHTSGIGCAAFAICLGLVQPAAALVNDETDARAFIVREAEIKRLQSGQEAAPSEAKTGPDASARQGASGKIAVGKDADGTKVDGKSVDGKSRRTPLAAPAGTEGLRALVARHASANGVPFQLADAVVRVESRYNPRAANAGNFGLMQIRHQTARGVGYSGGAAGLLDAETNARFGMKYLAQAYRLAGGDTCRSVMKYQSGHMAAHMSGANRTYCSKVRTIIASN